MRHVPSGIMPLDEERIEVDGEVCLLIYLPQWMTPGHPEGREIVVYPFPSPWEGER